MPESSEIVIITGPLLALIAAWQTLSPLQCLYKRVLVPEEVARELEVGGSCRVGCGEFAAAQSWLTLRPARSAFSPLLANSLDVGEAGVIQLALDDRIATVCIDETVGRRVARLAGLQVTGSIGVLIKAIGNPAVPDIRLALERMQERGIWLSERVKAFALSHS